MTKSKWWTRGIVGIILVSILWVLSISSKQIERSQRIEKEVALLESEAIKIRHENETLSEKIQYFSSDDFREQEAKKKLGLQKEKETVVIINSRLQAEQQPADKPESLSKPAATEDVPNYKKWWRLFF